MSITPCWEWQYAKDPNGYGKVRTGKITLRAHWLSYQLHKGPVPRGKVVHHECENPGCWNPEHLVAVSRKEHAQLHGFTEREGVPVRLKVWPQGILKAEKPERCRKGHLLDEANTWIRGNGRWVCRACANERVKRWKKAHPEETRAMRRRQRKKQSARRLALKRPGVDVDLIF